MNERPYLSIGDVLALLRDEFPDITISKIRFLESRGLLDPERTPSGYRKFQDEDVERLRWILRQQREYFLPLRVIKGRLDGTPAELENGEAPHLFDVGGPAGLAPPGESFPAPPGQRLMGAVSHPGTVSHPGADSPPAAAGGWPTAAEMPIAAAGGSVGGPPGRILATGGSAARPTGAIAAAGGSAARPAGAIAADSQDRVTSAPAASVPSLAAAPSAGVDDEPGAAVAGQLDAGEDVAARAAGEEVAARAAGEEVAARAAGEEVAAQAVGIGPGGDDEVPPVAAPPRAAAPLHAAPQRADVPPANAPPANAPPPAAAPPSGVRPAERGAARKSNAAHPRHVPVGPAPAAAVPVDTEEPPAEAAAPQRPAPAAKRTRAESDSARSSRARRTGRPVATGVSLSTAELADASGLTSDEIANLESYGLITGKTVAGVRCFDEEGLIVARLSAAFAQHGIEPRHLRTFKHAAAREAGLFEQIVTPLLRQRNPEARSRAEDVLGELTELGGSLRSALLRAALRDLTG